MAGRRGHSALNVPSWDSIQAGVQVNELVFQSQQEGWPADTVGLELWSGGYWLLSGSSAGDA